MKTFRILIVLAAAILAISPAACSDSDNHSPASSATVYLAGMAWDPDYGDGEIPIPVWWNGVDTPTRLPMLPFSDEDCPPSGSVEAMTIVNNQVVMVGISSICLEGSQNMKPALWRGGTVMQLALLPEAVLGVALDVAFKDDVLYIVGATGAMSPLPVIWVDGYPIELPLPDDYDAGEAHKIVIEGDYIYVSALLSKGEAGSLTWAVGYWKFDKTLEWNEWTYISLPEEADGANSPVPIAAAGEDVWAVINPYGGHISEMKPALSMNGGVLTPLGSVYGLAYTGTSTLAVGYETLAEQYDYNGPVMWTDTTAEKLSTVDESLGIGTAYSVQFVGADVYIGGWTYKKDPEDEKALIAVPAYWKNGVRHDREGLSTTGSDPLNLSSFGSWPKWPDKPAKPKLPTTHYGTNASQSAVVQAIAVK